MIESGLGFRLSPKSAFSTFALLQLFLHLRRTALQYGRLLMTLHQIVNNDDDGDENNDDIGDDDGECAHVIGCADMCAA